MDDEITLEAAIERLDEIARALEDGDRGLAESLALYEEGVRLLRVCERLLTAAEARVEQLRATGDGFRFDVLPERS
ncbi:MAG: exodeoxyribonuclease VII small subunit [Gemmatimonadetes bacterium]|nr:exodeoxyribonuclease VII small subunit [Gemmatimonadota bacterium]